MKNNRAIVIFLVIVLGLITVGLVFAYDGYGMHRDGYGGHMMGYSYDGRHMMTPGYDGNMMGYGYNGHHMMGPDYGGHMMGYRHGRYMHNDDACGNLTEEQSAKLDAARNRFFNDTRELRRSINEKQLALETELNKAAPDKTRALELQQQLSGLRNQFDQKALAHRIEIRKIAPDGYTARGYGHGRCW